MTLRFTGILVIIFACVGAAAGRVPVPGAVVCCAIGGALWIAGGRS